MMKSIFISLAVILIFTLPVSGEDAAGLTAINPTEEQDNHFAEKRWHGGPYFLGGIGPSETISITSRIATWSYAGCHLFLNLGYWAYDAFGIELGGFINYSYFEDLAVYDYSAILPAIYGMKKIADIDAHLWDSSFCLSVVVRLPFVKRTDLFNPCFKILVGYGISVYWIKHIHSSILLEAATDGYLANLFWLKLLPESGWSRKDRFQSDGPVFGFSLGNIFNAFNDETVWYLQLTVIAKMYREVIAVKDGAVLPTKIANFDNINNNHIIQLHLTAGIRFF